MNASELNPETVLDNFPRTVEELQLRTYTKWSRRAVTALLQRVYEDECRLELERRKAGGEAEKVEYGVCPSCGSGNTDDEVVEPWCKPVTVDYKAITQLQRRVGVLENIVNRLNKQ